MTHDPITTNADVTQAECPCGWSVDISVYDETLPERVKHLTELAEEHQIDAETPDHRSILIVNNGENHVECRCGWTRQQGRDGVETPIYEPRSIQDLVGVGRLHAEISNEQSALDRAALRRFEG